MEPSCKQPESDKFEYDVDTLSGATMKNRMNLLGEIGECIEEIGIVPPGHSSSHS